ncbi:hypothetical protein CC1G_15060 [Coprinopsis cinerea okayama7|uniref:Uncharacterized protein n=1 Tax=Coprinopsis cinerea (strain Okayama-7 / 130 / ATCC MYA-4618 / FGSC 9003) TaxID=240176 RepID=D6RP74_COPC7|nr:hypothetical protein CC1G_15060 [Coprinopsis cinerea okayama7\|eukprot:XP_002910726.1 hypothetical protein CC1G_15060 [Coprinopsis cinerea okayama7\
MSFPYHSPLFSNPSDRRNYDPLRWQALQTLCESTNHVVDDFAFNNLIQCDTINPVLLRNYSYPEAYHWTVNTAQNVSTIALFDFPAMMVPLGEHSSLSTYFDFDFDPQKWDLDHVLSRRAIVECGLLEQDEYAPFPYIAKKRSADMMALLRKVYQTTEMIPANSETIAVPFWRSYINGPDVFRLESNPMFEVRQHASPSPLLTVSERHLRHLTDKCDLYRSIRNLNVVFTPPEVFYSNGSFLHPNDFLTVLKPKTVVWISSALCRVQNTDGIDHYKHRLLKLHVVPSNQVST